MLVFLLFLLSLLVELSRSSSLLPLTPNRDIDLISVLANVSPTNAQSGDFTLRATITVEANYADFVSECTPVITVATIVIPIFSFSETGLIGTTSTSHSQSCTLTVNGVTKTTACTSFDGSLYSQVYPQSASSFALGTVVQVEFSGIKLPRAYTMAYVLVSIMDSQALDDFANVRVFTPFHPNGKVAEDHYMCDSIC